MKEFITDLLTKVNNSLDTKIKDNSPLIVNNFFKSIYSGGEYNQGTYNLSTNNTGMLFIPIYRDSQIENNHLPSWCEIVNNGFTASVQTVIVQDTDPLISTATIEKTFRIKKSGFYLIEYEMPRITSFTLSSNPLMLGVGQYHLNANGTSQKTSGSRPIYANFTTDTLKTFFDSRKRDVFYFEKGSLLGGMFFIIADTASNNQSISMASDEMWSADYSYVKITPVNYYR